METTNYNMNYNSEKGISKHKIIIQEVVLTKNQKSQRKLIVV